jgi:hypothetical protein
LAEEVAGRLGVAGRNKLTVGRVKLALARVADKSALSSAATGPRTADELTDHLWSWLTKSDRWWRAVEQKLVDEEPAKPRKPEPPPGPGPNDVPLAELIAQGGAPALFQQPLDSSKQEKGKLTKLKKVLDGSEEEVPPKRCDDCGSNAHTTDEHRAYEVDIKETLERERKDAEVVQEARDET